MKSTLPAAHLMRQYVLFFLVVIFLLTMVRAALALWHFPALEQSNAFIPLFLQGLRFDLAVAGLFCLVPIVLGSLLAMFRATHTVAKWLVGIFLFGGLSIILFFEFITPWFLQNMSVRPDIDIIKSVEAPVEQLKDIVVYQLIPLIIALLLCALILVAYWGRMELYRFLRFPASKGGAFLTLLLGGFLCALAIRSEVDFTASAMGPEGAEISTNATINDIAMNTTYKVLYSLASPFLN